MTNQDSSKISIVRWVGAIALIVVAGIVLTRMGDQPTTDPGPPTPESEANTAAGGQADPEAPMREATTATLTAGRVPAPAVFIEDKGRLRVKLEALRDGDVLAIGLAMPDEARGEAPLPTKIVDPEGRRMLELEARGVDGAGNGVRLDLDPEWLTPGTYMIQTESRDGTHFPIRRYVLEVE